MNSDRIRDWLEIVGIAAVVASLIFVGLQLKQSQDIAIAAQYQARHDANADVILATLQSEPAMSVWGQDIAANMQANPELPDAAKQWAQEQPVEELAARQLLAVATLKNYDNIYFQYQNGFLSEEMWQAMHIQLRMNLNNPRSWTRPAYEYEPMIWRESFREVVDEILSENQTS